MTQKRFAAASLTTESPPGRPNRTVKLVALLLACILIPTLGLLLLEGASSVILVVHDIGRDDRPVGLDRLHTQYDSLLGWVNIPTLTIPYMYGPGIGLHINSEGFRNDQDVSIHVGPGRLRVLCSGDSFTFGYGVDNDHTWCDLLTVKDQRIESGNMGEVGFGVDQAYLGYKRDGIKLDHAVQVFAYVGQDFDRMESDEFNGYPKPTLALHDHSLVTEHVPVPRRATTLPLVTRVRRALGELRLDQLALRVLRKNYRTDSIAHAIRVSVTWEVAHQALDDLARINRAKHSTLVVVHLPLVEDHWSGVSNRWRAWARSAAERGDFVFVDLVEDFKRLPRDSVNSMFVLIERPDLPIARWHYTVAGNQWVADRVYQRLMAIPDVANRLHRCGRETKDPC